MRGDGAGIPGGIVAAVAADDSAGSSAEAPGAARSHGSATVGGPARQQAGSIAWRSSDYNWYAFGYFHSAKKSRHYYSKILQHGKFRENLPGK